MKILLKISIVSLFLFSISHSGTLYDDRDGQRYTTVKIGDYEWMAENLKYDTKHSVCYDDELENCDLLGRLYLWSEAMRACPKGWHLPSKREFVSLENVAGNADLLGKKLKSASRWDGSNELEFSAVPGGYCFELPQNNDSLYCNSREKYAIFWSSEKINRDSIYRIQLTSGYSWAVWAVMSLLLSDGSSGDVYFSVRCVRKNTEVTERYEPSANYQEKTAPVKPTATCKDGTISFSQTRSGTCAGHGGVEKWEDSEENQNIKPKSKEVEKRYEQPTYNREANSSSRPTAICADGTVSYSQSRRGTCSGHGGVEKWEDSEENQNRKQRYNEVEERYEPPTYNREEYSPPQPTATCADGTTSYSQSRRGTCSGHGGVEKWEDSEKKQKSKQNDFGVGSLLKLFF